MSAVYPAVSDNFDQPKDVAAEVDVQGSALLGTLIGFIHPIVAAMYSSSLNSHQAQADRGLSAARMRASVEGRELVKALGNFVQSIVSDHVNDSHTDEAATEKNETPLLPEKSPYMASAPSVLDEPPVAPNDLQSSISRHHGFSKIEALVNAHVFNEMPIRVIAFDEQGSNLRLVERNEIVTLVMSRIKAVYPNGIDDASNKPDEIAKAFSKYAILSHTWIRGVQGAGEVMYQDWDPAEHAKRPMESRGHAKITSFCQVAARDFRLSFGWMDTVCIDKRSSSELDESIRSMYKWYKNSDACVTFLAETSNIDEMQHDSWFTRGWTLQELVAPSKVVFYNRQWHQLLLDYDGPAIHKKVILATSLTQLELVRLHSAPHRIPISRIMQLAAKRKVTREEDSIYSLMGLLGVGIPIAYGEGCRSALRRLIREIMLSRPTFMDIFDHQNPDSIIPSHVSDYTYSQCIETISRERHHHQQPVVFTHKGVHLTAIMIPAFLRSVYGNHIPSASTTQIFKLEIDMLGRSTTYEYILLDDSDHSTTWIHSLPRLKLPPYIAASQSPHMLYLAILDSGFDRRRGSYRFPTHTVCIPVQIRSIGKNLGDIDVKSDQYRTSGPRIVTLPYGAHSSSDYRISPEKASQLGIRLVTRYFK